MELSIVMPCLNEAETLASCLVKAFSFIEKNGIQGEVIVADNGSTDGSIKIAEELGARVVHVPIRGYGAACAYGSEAAEGRYIVMGDSDDSYDFSDLGPFLERLREGWDLVMGNRFRGGIKSGAMPWKNRWIGNPVLTGIGRLFFSSYIGDFHCGLRGYSKEAFRKMNLRSMGMEFASEMVIKAHLMGLRIAEVPTVLAPDGRSRPPHLRPWRDGWRHLRLMLLFSPQWLFMTPGLLMMLFGLCVGSLLLQGPLHLGHLEFGINTLVYMASLVMLGFQATLFWVFTKVFAITEGLLPPDANLERFFQAFTLEVGLVVGFVIMACGIFGGFESLSFWSSEGFGALNPLESLRIVIPSSMGIMIGFQIILASFFLSVLNLRVKGRPDQSPSHEA